MNHKPGLFRLALHLIGRRNRDHSHDHRRKPNTSRFTRTLTLTGAYIPERMTLVIPRNEGRR